MSGLGIDSICIESVYSNPNYEYGGWFIHHPNDEFIVMAMYKLLLQTVLAVALLLCIFAYTQEWTAKNVLRYGFIGALGLIFTMALSQVV